MFSSDSCVLLGRSFIFGVCASFVVGASAVVWVIGCYGARLFHVIAGFGVAWFYFRCALFVVVWVGGSWRAWFVCARV